VSFEDVIEKPDGQDRASSNEFCQSSCGHAAFLLVPFGTEPPSYTAFPIKFVKIKKLLSLNHLTSRFCCEFSHWFK